MTLESRLTVAMIGVVGILLILRLLQKRQITEGLFYLWLTVFSGIIFVGTSHRIQVALTRFIGAYDPVSTLLLLALAFLFAAALFSSILISAMNARIRDLTAYVAEIRLDLDQQPNESSTRVSKVPTSSHQSEENS